MGELDCFGHSIGKMCGTGEVRESERKRERESVQRNKFGSVWVTSKDRFILYGLQVDIFKSL